MALFVTKAATAAGNQKEIMMAKKFNKEKVLYFASQGKGFEVRHGEPKGTTCREIVSDCYSKGLLSKSKETEKGVYYTITLEGEKHLLRMQIAWRKANGKDCSSHIQKLEEITQ